MTGIPKFDENRTKLKANWDEMDRIKKTEGKGSSKIARLLNENRELLKENRLIAEKLNPRAKAFFKEAGIDFRKTPKISSRAKELVKSLKYAPSDTKHYGHTESE